MKTILFSWIFLFTGYMAQGQIKFEEGNFASVIEKAGKENKLIFIDCYTSWCGPCKKMAAVIFPSKEAGDFMNSRFINFKADMEKGEGIRIREKYGVNAFPTLLILKSNGEELNRIAGMEPDTAYFISKIKEISNPENSLEYKRSRYEEDIEQANGYLLALYSARKEKEFNERLVEVFNRRTPAQRYTVRNFEIYANAIQSVSSQLSEMILKDKADFIKYLGKEYYETYIRQQTENTILSLYMNNLRSVPVEACRAFTEFAQQYGDIQKTYMYAFFERSYEYACERDIDNFIKICREFYKGAESNHQINILKLAARMCITSNNKELLREFHTFSAPLAKDSSVLRRIEQSTHNLNP